ncbi:MAG: hypothetical protein KAQ66_08445, partial [Rhodospirillaceae bacterium]|nr:hypothetical protein [Rhodospirillaceae bacterium]
MQYFDIILFALIAVFLVLRLRSMLGGRDGFDGNNEGDQPNDKRGGMDGENNVIRLPENRANETPAVDIDVNAPAEADAFEEGPLKDGIRAIVAADPSFKARDFVDGSKMAFEMIL